MRQRSPTAFALTLGVALFGVALSPHSSASGTGGAAGDDPPPTCSETWSNDRPRPRVDAVFPARGTAGYVAELTVTVHHLLGERVFPGGLTLEADAPERALLEKAGFRLPDAESGVAARIERKEEGTEVKTTFVLPVIPLPDEAGRRELVLPALPVSISRASGQVQTLCTGTARIVVEDPLASVNGPTPKLDPAARPQREIWWTARNAVLVLLVALPLALALFFALRRLWPMLRKAPPPPPPTPPWQTALAELSLLEGEGLLEQERYEEHLDRTVDVLRKYLGARYGFEGLERTTRELLRDLAERAPDLPEEIAVRGLLQRTDLVKFARRLPDRTECRDAVEQVRRIVKETTPAVSLDPRVPRGTPK